MSIKLKKAKDSNWGKLEITSEADRLSEEEYIDRMHALIGMMQQQEEFSPVMDFYHVLEILRDMLPTAEQAKKMFNSPH